MKWHDKDCETIFVKSIPSQTPGCRICKEFLKLNKKKTNNTNIKGIHILDRHITKEDIQILKNAWKNAQHLSH